MRGGGPAKKELSTGLARKRPILPVMRRGKKYAVILRFVTVGCTLGDFVVKISRHNTQTCDGTAADDHEGEGLMRDHVKTLQRLKKLRS